MRYNRLLLIFALAAGGGLAVIAGAYLWKWSRLPEGHVETDPREAIAKVVDLGDIRIPAPGADPVPLAPLQLPVDQPITVVGRVIGAPPSDKPRTVDLSFCEEGASPQSYDLAGHSIFLEKSGEPAAFRCRFLFSERHAGPLTLRLELRDADSREERLIAQGRATVTQDRSKANR